MDGFLALVLAVVVFVVFVVVVAVVVVVVVVVLVVVVVVGELKRFLILNRLKKIFLRCLFIIFILLVTTDSVGEILVG